ncbi:maleylpyruvate isomerase N-terminal domain-containing protein [Streptomyces xanthophaeus]|uniref:maleylpyruvate isomerase N-terminal domain-containing protein n=1 Tax=Streptomyces xanthophaeus TaxID=67385 RepID=UPI0026481899|nr:maleylpyruvate isomerase N-terminal domain-containing protein [Streptomyces xanthophaeus]WKD31887.1 maleylpyruvate isomerase N-terminal domain-containing protein [Streptomyces xanthophaeus]
MQLGQQLLGTGRRWWAAIVAAGPAEAPPAKDAAQAPRELEALLAWYAESNELLLGALREAGPERECWTWWAAGASPTHAWGVARRRVHEVLVHTYDAQLGAGAVQPMPADVAIDGVAGQLLLYVWGRLTLSGLKIEGDQQVFEQLIAWEPEE